MTQATLTVTVTVRFYAAARAAAGTQTRAVALPPQATVATLLDELRTTHGDELARILERCSYLLDEVAVRDTAVPLADGATLDVLPPFAGG